MMEDLSLHVLDIAENAIAAGATRVAVAVNENDRRNLLTVRVSDNGPGMSKEVLRRALDPFFTTKGKRTGLGLPMLSQAAEMCGGGMKIETSRGTGTRVTASFQYGHVDRPPLTKMANTIALLVLSHPEIEFRYSHRLNGRVFRFAGPRLSFAAGLGPDLIDSVERRLRDGLRGIGRT